jgi:ankyrin repeat protein
MVVMRARRNKLWWFLAFVLLAVLLSAGWHGYRQLLANAFVSAAAAGEVPRMQRLLRWGADPNGAGTLHTGRGAVAALPLLAAIHGRQPEAMRWLIAHGARLLIRTDQALLEDCLEDAIGACDDRCIGILVQANPGADPARLLYGAVVADNLDAAYYLLTHGVSPNARTFVHGELPLCAVRSASMARLLLDAGAEPTAVGHLDNTPLHTAHHPEIVRLLLAHGANTHLRNARGETPLHCAYSAAIAAQLLAADAEVNARDNKGATPLIAAVLTADTPSYNDAPTRRRLVPALLTLLLAHGADLHAVDNVHYTALRYAEKRQYADLATLLRAHGAVE